MGCSSENNGGVQMEMLDGASVIQAATFTALEVLCGQ